MDIGTIPKVKEKITLKRKIENPVNFDEIASAYPNILLDTSVIIGSLDRNSSADSYEDFFFHNKLRLKFYRRFKEIKSIDLFYKTMDNYQFSVTKSVLNEIEVYPYSYKKAIKSGLDQGNKPLLKLRRAIDKHNKIKRNLISRLEGEGRIFKLNEGEQETYNFFYNKYLKLKEARKLSEPDFDFLISGLVSCKKRGPTAIISNDFPVLFVWSGFLDKENENFESFGFYLRINDVDFEKARA